MRDAGKYFGLDFMFCILHEGARKNHGDKEEGKGEEQFFFFPRDDIMEGCYGIGIPPDLQHQEVVFPVAVM